MITELELYGAVDDAFAVTGDGLARWPDPHPDRSPRDEEYSRLSDPAKWRIVGARADAWAVALVGAGVADDDHGSEVRWAPATRLAVSRTHRVVPRAAGALPLVIARGPLGPVDDACVTLGAGDPAVCITSIPDCGCDACDSGSQDVLDELDEYMFGVVSGAFRRLWSVDREITVIGDQRWRASGPFARGEVQAVLADPVGWHEVSGASWLAES